MNSIFHKYSIKVLNNTHEYSFRIFNSMLLLNYGYNPESGRRWIYVSIKTVKKEATP
jgi:hypothetical protein